MKIFNKLIYWLFKLFGITNETELTTLYEKQVWYGRVNDWKNLKATEKDIICCMNNGVAGYMIELAGDIPGKKGPQPWTDAWLKDIEEKYKKLVKMTRSAGLWLFVSIVNDNMGQGKYGDKSPKLEKVLAMAKSLALIVKKNGKLGVVVQPVAETQTTAGNIFEKYCRNELYNFPLVFNGNGGFPTGTCGFNFRAVHPSSTTKQCPSDAFVISDHSKLIKELAQGETYDGTIREDKCNTWFYTVFHISKCRVIGYYAFLRTKHDKKTITTLGKFLKKYK